MTKTKAIHYVYAHDDDSEFDLTELTECFTALYERQPDAQDVAEGLWSHCCAAVAGAVGRRRRQKPRGTRRGLQKPERPL